MEKRWESREADGMKVDIVIVDDEPECLELMENILRPHYSVAAFTNPSEALAHLQAYGARLLVTDLAMAQMNGFMVITDARRIDPAIRAVLVSAHINDEASSEQEIVDRFDAVCLSKPFTVDGLLKAVKGLLNG